MKQFRPFLLGGIMKGTENRPPGSVPAKMVYMGTDLQRLADFYQIPLQAPADVAEVMFKKGSLKAQRFLTAVETMSPDKLENLSRQLWLRIWSRDEDITEDQSLCEAGLKAGISQGDVDKMLEMIKTNDIKEKLKQRTQEALDLGAFGSPFIVVHMEDGKKETFFGSDRMELMAHVIGEKWEGPLTKME